MSCRSEKAEEDEMNSIVKVGWTSSLAVGLAILAFQGGHAQTSSRNYVYSKNPSAKGLPFSEAVLAGDTLYVAGHIGVDQKTGQAPNDLDQEMKLLFDGIRADMAEVNFGMDDLVSV